MAQVIKLQRKADQAIAQAKQTAAQRYQQGLKNITADMSGVSSQYDPSMRTRKGQDYYNRQQDYDNRRERIQQAREQRSGGVSGMLRSGLLKTTGAPTVRDFVSTTVPRGLKSVGLMPYSQEERLAQRQAAVRSSIRPVAMGRRASANLRTTMQNMGAVDDDGQLVRSSTSTDRADRIAASKARKQDLISAGFGKGGANTTAILAGRTAASQRNSGGGGGGGGSGSGGGGGGRSGSGGGANAGGGRGGMFGSNAMTMSFVLPMLMDMFSGGQATSESSARSQAMTQCMGMTMGTSLMTGSMITEMTQGMSGMAAYAGPLAAGVVAVVGLTKAMIDAENAARKFAIEAASKKLEISLEKTSKSMDAYNRDIKNTIATQNVVSDLGRSTANATSLEEAQGRTQRGFMNFFDSGPNADIRSEILMKKGTSAYLQASSSDQELSRQYATLIPEKAAELAKNFAGVAQQASAFLESRFKQGASTENLQKDPQYKSFIKSLALADTAVQESILSIKNLASVSEEEKRRRIAEVIAIESTEKARQIEADTIKAMQLEEFNRSSNQFQNSLERMFQNMEQSINKSAFALDNMSQKAELSAAALSGSAKSAKTNLRSINVLQNPRAYGAVSVGGAINNASSSFGDSASTMQGLLRAAGAFEDTILSTINRTIVEDPTASDTKIGIKIEENLNKALQGLELPSDISSKLGKEVRQAIGKIRTKGDEKIDFADLVEKVPQLSKVVESAKRAQEVAIKTLQHWENALNSYGDSMNQIVDIQIQANDKLRKANDIGLRGRLALDKALGKEVSMRDEISISLAGVRNQTGGVTDPNLIRQNIQRLETTRQEQQDLVSGAGEQVGNASGVIDMQKNLNRTNIALRENYAALRSLADNSEAAGIAMSKLNEIQQKRSATENLIEKAVTSSPQELNSFNRALARVQNNMRGIANIGTTGEQRQESLSALKDILPLLGTGQQQDSIRANVLESMLQESGVGISPIFAQAIQALRNPEADPEMQQAITEYKKANELQEAANRALADLDQQIITNTEASSATALVTAMKGVTFDFNNAELKDIASDIKSVKNILDERLKAGAPVARASGGLIYASAGQFVNFQPKGTDTVPAMLTPGEFVVNKKATKQNFPLLNKINSGNYSSGGKVKYYDKGGFVFGEAGERSDPLDYKGRAEPVSQKEYPLPFDAKSKARYDGTSNMIQLYAAPGNFYSSIVGAEDGIYPQV